MPSGTHSVNPTPNGLESGVVLHLAGASDVPPAARPHPHIEFAYRSAADHHAFWIWSVDQNGWKKVYDETWDDNDLDLNWVQFEQNLTPIADIKANTALQVVRFPRNQASGQGYENFNRLFGFDKQGPNGAEWKPLTRWTWHRDSRLDQKETINAKPGDWEVTLDPNCKELWFFAAKTASNAGGWTKILSEAEIKEWIASLKLFEGTVTDNGSNPPGVIQIQSLPALDDKLVGHYWTWVGQKYNIGSDPGDAALNLNGQVIEPGDWLQIANDSSSGGLGLHWVRVGGDLLSKQRAEGLFGLAEWTAGDYEEGTTVHWGGYIYRSNSNVVAADPQPGPGSAKWDKVELDFNVHDHETDATLPSDAPGNEIHYVTSSALRGGKPNLLIWDQKKQPNDWTSLLVGELSELSDVTLTNVENRDRLLYDNDTSQWVNKNNSIAWDPQVEYGYGEIVMFEDHLYWADNRVNPNPIDIQGNGHDLRNFELTGIQSWEHSSSTDIEQKHFRDFVKSSDWKAHPFSGASSVIKGAHTKTQFEFSGVDWQFSPYDLMMYIGSDNAFSGHIPADGTSPEYWVRNGFLIKSDFIKGKFWDRDTATTIPDNAPGIGTLPNDPENWGAAEYASHEYTFELTNAQIDALNLIINPQGIAKGVSPAQSQLWRRINERVTVVPTGGIRPQHPQEGDLFSEASGDTSSLEIFLSGSWRHITSQEGAAQIAREQLKFRGLFVGTDADREQGQINQGRGKTSTNDSDGILLITDLPKLPTMAPAGATEWKSDDYVGSYWQYVGLKPYTIKDGDLQGSEIRDPGFGGTTQKNTELQGIELQPGDWLYVHNNRPQGSHDNVRQWQRISGPGGGTPIDLSGGHLIYERPLVWNGQGTAPNGKYPGDLLFNSQTRDKIQRWENNQWQTVMESGGTGITTIVNENPAAGFTEIPFRQPNSTPGIILGSFEQQIKANGEIPTLWFTFPAGTPDHQLVKRWHDVHFRNGVDLYGFDKDDWLFGDAHGQDRSIFGTDSIKSVYVNNRLRIPYTISGFIKSHAWLRPDKRFFYKVNMNWQMYGGFVHVFWRMQFRTDENQPWDYAMLTGQLSFEGWGLVWNDVVVTIEDRHPFHNSGHFIPEATITKIGV